MHSYGVVVVSSAFGGFRGRLGSNRRVSSEGAVSRPHRFCRRPHLPLFRRHFLPAPSGSFRALRETYFYLEVGGILVSFCYAANALVRFRGTHDRTALILAFGFVLSGIIETVGYFGLREVMQAGPAALSSIPMGWMVGRTILSVLLLSAIAVERYIPTARQPSKETAGALLVVAIAAYLTSAAFLAAPSAPVAHAVTFISRPWDLLPGVLFLIAAICFRQRLQISKNNKSAASLYDYSLFAVASLNVVCHVSAAFSRHLFDGPFFLAELSKTASYVVMLSGALLDQARLFEQVRSMAVSDSLTGLANYRRLISVLEAELDRSRRTQRPFSVVLLDMDGLKTINDHYGHLTGSRAIVRLSKDSTQPFSGHRYRRALRRRRICARASRSWPRYRRTRGIAHSGTSLRGSRAARAFRQRRCRRLS